MEYAIVKVPAAPVRKKPNHRAEMSNQLFFGEAVKVLKIQRGKWVRVESLYDGYKGWLTQHLVSFTDEAVAKSEVLKLSGDLVNTVKTEAGAMNIPAGSSLRGFGKKRGVVGSVTYQYNGNFIEPQRIGKKAEAMIDNAHRWLNAPYMWGGKTIFGVDCSGFVQTMYKLVGVAIPRDARQQVKKGKPVKKLEEAQAGDLAFFDHQKKIVHVGILLGPDKIIHSAGNVRIDAIDEKGIINSDTGERTHSLKAIKRFL